MKWLPNALTILRCILAFVVAWAIIEVTLGSFTRAFDVFATDPNREERNTVFATNQLIDRNWSLIALSTFIFAAVLDFLDGWLARKLNAESDFGRVLDPIADKLLVGIPLLIAAMLALAWPPFGLVIAIPCLAIVFRDIFITWLRFSKWGGAQTRVSTLAKWKTALEFLAVGLPLTVIAIERFSSLKFGDPLYVLTWIVLLYLAAALSLYTGYQYVRTAFSEPAP